MIAIALVGCGSGGSEGEADLPPGTFRSTVINGHTHEIRLDGAELATPPPGGVTRTTTTALGHAHGVTLTDVQLDAIVRNRAVTVETTPAGGHTHVFTFR